MNKVIVIAGPTASGKTGLGIEVAGAIGGEIISADSMQVYKNMPIATAAPTDDEKSQAPHHLVEFLDNDKKFSVALWCTLAKEKIDDIISRGKVPIVVGGTGLFIDSLVDNISFEDVEVDEDLRQSLMKRDVDSLYDELLRVDKKAAENIHKNNKSELFVRWNFTIWEVQKQNKTKIHKKRKALMIFFISCFNTKTGKRFMTGLI